MKTTLRLAASSKSLNKLGVTRTGLVAVAAAAFACGAAAQVQIYGTVDLAVGVLESQPPGPPNTPISKVTGVHNGGVQTSYFGFRGSEDLGGGLKANFQMESFFRADTGASGRFGPPSPAQDPFFSRASWVGLQGGFGDVKIGNVSNPAWLSMIFSSAMGGNSLFSPGFRQQFNGSTRGINGQDTSLPNTVLYSTPSISGVVASIALQSKEAVTGKSNIVGNVVYRAGPLMLTAAASKVRHTPPPDAPVAENLDYYLLGGSYDFKVAKVFLQYAQQKNNLNNVKDKLPHVGVTVPVGAGEFQLAWAKDSARGGANNVLNYDRTTTSLGYVYNLSKRSSLYGMATSDKLRLGTAKSYVVGMRHAF